MNLSHIYYFLKENFSLEDIFLLGLIILFALERKCDKLFIAILMLIFIAGLNKDLFSIALEKTIFFNIPGIRN